MTFAHLLDAFVRSDFFVLYYISFWVCVNQQSSRYPRNAQTTELQESHLWKAVTKQSVLHIQQNTRDLIHKMLRPKFDFTINFLKVRMCDS